LARFSVPFLSVVPNLFIAGDEPHEPNSPASGVGDRRRWKSWKTGGSMVFMSEGEFEIADWPHLEAWAGRLKAMPGFALPYDLIPSKDREFDPV
jgi:hypothetical protein